MGDLVGSVKRMTGNAYCLDACSFAVACAEEIIKNYCGIHEIPQCLFYTAARMAVDILRMGNYGGDDSGDMPMVARSVKIGDTDVTFADAFDRSANAAYLCARYEHQLNRFRRVRFDE